MPTFVSDNLETEYVDGPLARYAYRRFGPAGGAPLILHHRFRATIDHWDPAFLAVLARERQVIIFDNAGVGFSTGEAPPAVAGMAGGSLGFIAALGLQRVDVLGWSMGGFVAQIVALDRPDLVRRVVVAASGPGAVPDAPGPAARASAVAAKAINDDEDLLYLFFPETQAAREAGLAA